jgi:uncharacterized protein (DUF1330 family)
MPTGTVPAGRAAQETVMTRTSRTADTSTTTSATTTSATTTSTTGSAGATVSRAGYAIAYLRHVRLGEEIATYLERIDETLEPFGGTFLVHGGRLLGLEGEWDGDVVIISFPSVSAAQEWYHSPGYQSILGLRTGNSESVAALVEGVPAGGYRAADAVAKIISARA